MGFNSGLKGLMLTANEKMFWNKKICCSRSVTIIFFNGGL